MQQRKHRRRAGNREDDRRDHNQAIHAHDARRRCYITPFWIRVAGVTHEVLRRKAHRCPNPVSHSRPQHETQRPARLLLDGSRQLEREQHHSRDRVPKSRIFWWGARIPDDCPRTEEERQTKEQCRIRPEGDRPRGCWATICIEGARFRNPLLLTQRGGSQPISPNGLFC
jgi:hypothetical protein